MVVIRESPRKLAPQPDQAWPPRSPFEALLSSPGGRKRFEERRARNSTSPTPVKRRRLDATSSPGKVLMQSDEDEDEDEDEETLQLKIKAYEAKLKLKRLQRSKTKPAANNGLIPSASITSKPAEAKPLRDAIQVPLSPVRRKQPSPQPASPARVLLGLENRAEDVSLKRAKRRLNGLENSPTGSKSPVNRDRIGKQGIKSFGDRLAESRVKQQEEEAKKARVEKARSKGFGVASVSSQRSNLSGSTLVSSYARAPTVARETASSTPLAQTLASSTTEPTASPGPTIMDAYSNFHLKSRNLDQVSLARGLTDKTLFSIPEILKAVTAPDYEPPDCESDYVVFGIIASKSAPHEHKVSSQSVDISADPNAAKPKFMVLKLTDLVWELDLFLFRSSLDAFYRVPVGTVVAVLNPGIMKPRPHEIHSGKFSLTLNSSDDAMLEIGQSKDLGFCSAKKANGMECLTWIDGRKTEVCEYHIALKVDQARKGRMQLSTMTNRGGSSGASYKGGGQRLPGSSGWGGKGKNKKNSGLLPEGKQFDAATRETYYIAPSGTNLTKFLDDQDADVNAWQRGCSKEEMLQKRRKQQDKERELAKRLAGMGNGGGQGAEYLKAHTAKALGAPTSTTPTGDPRMSAAVNDGEDPFAPRDAASLGLLSNSAASVSLAAPSNSSAAKRKHLSAFSSVVSEPMGWGGAYKPGLLQPPPSPKRMNRAGEDGAGQKEKKRARFMLESKGIREPGRESLGNVIQGRPDTHDDDDDDDLEIVL